MHISEIDKNDEVNSIDEYYTEKFVTDSQWNTPYPNLDQANRASRILPLVARVARHHYSINRDPLRFIDVGCGKGWLTALLSLYGHGVGIDPVCDVVQYAKKIYPHLTFVCATPTEYLKNSSPDSFDLVVCSEVIEHITRDSKMQFLIELKNLVKQNGSIILTTPRGELFDVWIKQTESTQPVEDWITEAELKTLAHNCGLEVKLQDRCNPTPLVRSRFHWLKTRKPVVNLMSFFGYQDATPWNSMIYQVIWLKKH